MPECSAGAIECAIRAAQDGILAAQRSGDGVAHMRATAVVLAIDTVRAVGQWGHLGDTRLYCFRGGRVLARTKDHSVVQRMVDAGYLDEDDARASPERSRLFAALGQEENYAPDISAPLALQNGDVFLLCTDGFWAYVGDDAMLAALHASASSEAWLGLMEREVIARGGDGQDNYSALAVWCGDSRRPPA